MSSMPSPDMSSIRPMKGDMNVAPALAANRAWVGEKQSVTFTGISSFLRMRHAVSPASVRGTLITMFLWIFARRLP